MYSIICRALDQFLSVYSALAGACNYSVAWNGENCQIEKGMICWALGVNADKFLHTRMPDGKEVG